MDESIDSGRSVRLWTSRMVRGQDGRLVGQRDTRVDVEHVRAGLDLGEDVAFDPAEVARLHLLGQELATGRVDALPDDDERAVEPDGDLA